jgi:hypothetical protein
MAITTQDQLIESLAQHLVPYRKVSVTTRGAGTFHSLWKVDGFPGPGNNPPLFTAGSGYQCTNATTGAMPYTNPTGGKLGYLARFGAAASVINQVILYDRLWSCSGLSANTASPQNIVTPGSLPARDALGTTDGFLVEPFFEVYAAPGANAATWSITYTASDGTPSRTGTYAHPNSSEAVGQLLPIALQENDQGVQSVQSSTLSNTGTAGNIGITLLRRLAVIPVPTAGGGEILDAIQVGLSRIYDSSCLAVMLLCSGTASGVIEASYTWAHG